MNQVIGQLISQSQDFFKSLPPIKRSALIAVSIILVVSMTIVSVMITGNNFETLFRNVDSEKLPLIIGKLQEKNIKFKLADGGRTIKVSKDLLAATQMALMSELSGADLGNIGLELFEKQDFGVSSYAQRVNFQRALQGELTRAINTLSSIKSSKVILAIPKKKTFLEREGEPSASVVLNVLPGRSVAEEQVTGIVQLVASAVEGLRPEKVIVVDSKGKVLSKNYGSGFSASIALVDLRNKIESQIESRIEQILGRAVGVSNVIAKVDATLDAQTMDQVEEKVDADGTAVRSDQAESEFLDGSRLNPTGIPGARSNLPGAGAQGSVGFRQNVKKEIKATNYSVPKTVTKISQGAGGVNRLSVAVMVDYVEKPITGANGEPSTEWVPRSSEELLKYETLVKSAIGFNSARGDVVKIENIQFDVQRFESVGLMTDLEKKKIIHSLFKWSLVGLSLALFFLIVIRPFMRWVTESFQDTVEDILPRTIEELEELQAVDATLPGMSGALPVLEESIDPHKAESELLKERIMTLVNQEEERSGAAFNLWMSRRDI